MEKPLCPDEVIKQLLFVKLINSNDSIQGLAKRYQTEEKIINFMFDKECAFNYRMFKIASDYLNIPYKDLVSLVDLDKLITPKKITLLNKYKQIMINTKSRRIRQKNKKLLLDILKLKYGIILPIESKMGKMILNNFQDYFLSGHNYRVTVNLDNGVIVII